MVARSPEVTLQVPINDRYDSWRAFTLLARGDCFLTVEPSPDGYVHVKYGKSSFAGVNGAVTVARTLRHSKLRSFRQRLQGAEPARLKNHLMYGVEAYAEALQSLDQARDTMVELVGLFNPSGRPLIPALFEEEGA